MGVSKHFCGVTDPGVYPGPMVWIFFPSRIQQQQKREGKKILVVHFL